MSDRASSLLISAKDQRARARRLRAELEQLCAAASILIEEMTAALEQLERKTAAIRSDPFLPPRRDATEGRIR